jgi:hypothetical protein
MNEPLVRIASLVQAEDVRISEHGYEELAADGLTAREIVTGVEYAILVEEYPDYPKGPSILVLQEDKDGNPVHVVWGVPKGHERPAVLVTAYRPDLSRWNDTFTERKS